MLKEGTLKWQVISTGRYGITTGRYGLSTGRYGTSTGRKTGRFEKSKKSPISTGFGAYQPVITVRFLKRPVDITHRPVDIRFDRTFQKSTGSHRSICQNDRSICQNDRSIITFMKFDRSIRISTGRYILSENSTGPSKYRPVDVV